MLVWLSPSAPKNSLWPATSPQPTLIVIVVGLLLPNVFRKYCTAVWTPPTKPLGAVLTLLSQLILNVNPNALCAVYGVGVPPPPEPPGPPPLPPFEEKSMVPPPDGGVASPKPPVNNSVTEGGEKAKPGPVSLPGAVAGGGRKLTVTGLA